MYVRVQLDPEILRCEDRRRHVVGSYVQALPAALLDLFLFPMPPSHAPAPTCRHLRARHLLPPGPAKVDRRRPGRPWIPDCGACVPEKHAFAHNCQSSVSTKTGLELWSLARLR